MTDDTRLDARVRGVLTDLPVPDTDATGEALQSVLARSASTRHRSAWVAPVLVAAAVALIALLVARLATGPDTEPPAPANPGDGLVGDWQHEVRGAEKTGWDGRWRLALTDDGVLLLSGPESASVSSEGASYRFTREQFRTDVFVNSACSELPAGVYVWRLDGDTLTLTELGNDCAERADVFAGTWRRVR